MQLDPPAWLVTHVTVAAEIAAFVARRAAAAGADLDVPICEAAALLHDVDKTASVRAEVPGRPHGLAGAEWSRRRGHEELAPAIASHPVTLLADDERYSRWRPRAAVEELIVAYADKRSGQRLVSLEERFADWIARYPEHREATLRAKPRALELERHVCTLARIAPEEVARLSWVAAAIAGAPSSGPAPTGPRA